MSFSEASLFKKIQELNNTQQSVQTLSLWLIHHRKHSKIIVQTWLKELVVSKKCDRKITFIYLANDILQNSRKKGSEFMNEFLKALPEAIENTSRMADTKLRFTLERIFNIWKDRKIYRDEKIKEFKEILHAQPKLDDDSPDTTDKSLTPSKSKITIKKLTSSDANVKSDEAVSKDEGADEARKRKISEDKSADGKSGETNPKTPKKSLKDEVLKELANNGSTIQAPEPLEIITMLQDLEKSASSDAVIREKIAKLPPKVIDVAAVKNLKDKKTALELSASVAEAAKLVDNYNSRLQQELANRKQTALLLGNFFFLS